MLFLPIENVLLRTTIPADEVAKKLDEVIGDPRGLKFWEARGEPYLGSLEGRAFTIWHQISYRNSFLPVINGHIVPAGRGSYVHLFMHPHLAVISFTALCVVILLVSLIGSVCNAVTNASDYSVLLPSLLGVILIRGGYLLFVYAMVIAGFKLESSKSMRFFIELLKPVRRQELGFPWLRRPNVSLERTQPRRENRLK